MDEAGESSSVVKPSSFYFLWQYGFLMLPAGLIGGLLLSFAFTTPGAPPLRELAEVGVGLIFLGLAAWPIVFELGARVVISEESIAKVYPLRLRRRTLLRRDLETIEAEQANARTSPLSQGAVLLNWSVLRFRARDGTVVSRWAQTFGDATISNALRPLWIVVSRLDGLGSQHGRSIGKPALVQFVEWAMMS